MMGRLPDFSTRPRGNGLGTVDWVLLVAGLGLLALSGRVAWRTTAELQEAQRSVEDLRRQTGRTPTGEGAAKDLGSLDRHVAALLLTADSPPPQVETDLVPLLPHDVRLTQINLAYREQLELELRVEARSAAAYDELLERLAASERFFALTPGSEDRDGEVRSTVRLSYRRPDNGGGS